jgi:ribosomal protein S18 acetylase RimI-like enzyme
VIIHPARADDETALVHLVAGFRASLARLRGRVHTPDLEAARREVAEYREKRFPIYVAEGDGGELIGYLVCRVDGDVVWAESLYVQPGSRRRGVGSALYAEAERLAQSLGGNALYNWVDPDNERIIRFLQKRGYNVLNLIELRRPYPDEEKTRKIQVGTHTFDR